MRQLHHEHRQRHHAQYSQESAATPQQRTPINQTVSGYTVTG
jgi:hypothetical protein